MLLMLLEVAIEMFGFTDAIPTSTRPDWLDA
jgi:hypothetical protein